jgi:hypothetical protein
LNIYNRPLAFFFIILISVILITSIWYACNIVSDPSVETTENVAQCLGVTPSWDRMREHLLFDLSEATMTKEDVHKTLDCFGPWTIELSDWPVDGEFDPEIDYDRFREIIHFDDENISKVMKRWNFVYDKDGKLVRVGFLES